MKIEERQEIILKSVREQGSVRVSDLTGLLGCSEVTIRSDIRKLDEKGLLTRTHGGAEKRGQDQSLALSLYLAGDAYYSSGELKKAIAGRAYAHIENGDSIMIDDSSTCCYLAEYIRDNPEKQVAVVTNSLYSAAILANCGHARVYLLGGLVTTGLPSAVDNITAESVKNYHANKLFAGIRRIDLRMGFTSSDAAHAEVKRAMIRNSDESYILCDHSKFGPGSLFTVCGINQVTGIITDAGLDSGTAAEISRLRLPVEIV